MAGRSRNQRCDCGSGRKAKFCCGVRKGPSDTEMAKAYLAVQLKPAARRLVACSYEEVEELHGELVELPCLDSSLQVGLPRLVTPEVNALLQAIEHDDVDALEEALVAVVPRVDTALERARLAQAVIELRDAGRIPVSLAAMAVVDLATAGKSLLATSALMQSAAVMLGAERTPAGLLIAS